MVAHIVMGIPNDEIYYTVQGKKYILESIPLYSTDIVAAFDVVEKMAERGLQLSLDRWGGDPWWAEFADKGWKHGGQATSTTVPLVICLAALKAIEDLGAS